jgi:hypothetical protein
MNDLNSNATVALESARVPARVGIVYIAHNFYDAGVFRAVSPESADYIDFYKDWTIVVLDFWAQWIRANASLDDPWVWEIARYMSLAASWLSWVDPFWCETVTAPGGGWCDYNDTIVPVWSQALPNAPNLLVSGGPTHTQETRNTDYFLYQALTGFMNIAPRGGDDDDDEGGPRMAEDSGIRGCADWSWLDPTWQPDAQSCLDLCMANGANACEWFQDGSCFVEFSSGGCYVEGGHEGWSAAVIP